MKKGRIIGAVLSAAMMVNCISPVMTAFGQTTGVFENPLAPVDRTQSAEKFTAKPLVILIDFPDYRYTELDEREKDFRINSFTGKETTADFYEKLFFGDETYKTEDGNDHITVNKFFKEESGGTYEFKGKVMGWYTADKPAATYGANVDKSDQKNARNLVLEAIQKASKDVDLSEFDIEDKWDLDGDGDYNEPDGIIDSLVVIHPGLGEEWGGGSLKEDAIWPFRWGFNVFGENMDLYTPAEKQAIVNKNHKVTDKSGKEFFVEDFTIFEQDLPLDLFCHEFGHVLGLPDLYDTNKSEPPVENWSIMGGSYTGNPRGSQPVSYGAYCKEFLQKDFEKRKRAANWQNMKKISLDDVTAEGIDVVLDQATLKGKNKDVVRIDLPKYAERVVMPTEGSQCFFSGKGDKLKNYMTTKTPIELSADSNAKLTFKTWYDIDPYFDFASVQ
ncbi:M6 family metalloprotease domain-containing protein, partial [Hathewaya proteolytica DSM 3090]